MFYLSQAHSGCPHPELLGLGFRIEASACLQSSWELCGCFVHQCHHVICPKHLIVTGDNSKASPLKTPSLIPAVPSERPQVCLQLCPKQGKRQKPWKRSIFGKNTCRSRPAALGHSKSHSGWCHCSPASDGLRTLGLVTRPCCHAA